jgi:Zn-dependent protease
VGSSLRLGRIRGVPVGIHWTWVLVAALVVWSLAGSLFPATYPGLAGSTYLLMALAAGMLFFASILLHELGHTLVALRQRMRIREVNLWLFGGVATF